MRKNFAICAQSYNDIEKIMKTAAELINTNKHILVLEARKELLRIPVSEIRYIESSGRYIIVHDSGGEYKLKGKLNDIYERVKGFGFLFIHKSYIVNNLYIRKYSYDNVELDDNVILPVSRQRREEIKKSCSIGLELIWQYVPSAVLLQMIWRQIYMEKDVRGCFLIY